MLKSHVIEELKNQLKLSGLVESSPEFENRLERLKINKCMELKQVYQCQACQFYDDCTLAKGYYMRLKYSPNSPVFQGLEENYEGNL